jgi:chemotaxis protein MotB
MADDTQRPIVIKRIKKSSGGHHGGAWKIAYADFVTAMMAFFLLMWLLGATTKGELQGIAEYFQSPLKVSLSGGSGAGDRTSAINAGGRDLTRSDDLQMRRGEVKEARRRISPREAQAEVARGEIAKLKGLKARLEELIAANELLQQYRNQLIIDMTSEGLRIQIMDALNRPMFNLGSAQLKPYARDILLALSKPLNEVENRLSLVGHTDATPYAAGERGYSNWELSAERANTSRRVLVSGGIADGKIKRVVGMASAVLFDANDPTSPANRRIAIIVLSRDAEESLNRVSGGVTVANDKGAAKDTPDDKSR